MSRIKMAVTIVILSVSLLTVCQHVNAQSGSRNGSGGSSGGISGGGGSGGGSGGFSRSRSTFSQRNRVAQRQREYQEQQQQSILQQQVNAELRRKQELQQVQLNPNSQLNKSQYIAAFKDAKAEFMAIRNGRRAATGQNLNRIFVLRTKEFDRTNRQIKWPRTFDSEPHKELTEAIDNIVAGQADTTQAESLLQQLNLQLEQRVMQKTISIKDYATAKRFVSGLANDAMR